MCLFRKKPPVIDPSEKTVIHYGKNVYPGQPLQGCVPDSNNALKNINAKWPNAIKFIQKLDADAIAKNWKADIEREISILPEGATVVVFTDSCFSESVTRWMGTVDKHPSQPRLFHPGYPRRTTSRAASHPKEAMKWLHISACGEHQTASDAYFKGYEGAFSHYLWKALATGITYRQLFKAVQDYLPNSNFEQTPIFEGPDYLLNRVLFDGPTLWIMNSSHGSYQYDTNGDEADGQDEGIYFDRLITDDEMWDMLIKIKV